MERPLTRNIRHDGAPLDLSGYQRVGGYEAVRSTIGKVPPAALINMVTESGLGGRGGGGFFHWPQMAGHALTRRASRPAVCHRQW